LSYFENNRSAKHIRLKCGMIASVSLKNGLFGKFDAPDYKLNTAHAAGALTRERMEDSF